MFEIKEILKVKTGLTSKLYSNTYERIRNLTPITKIAALNMVAFLNENAEKIGGTAFISQGYRSAEEQNQLYQQGRTVEGKKVTNADGVINKSAHQLGIAFDVAIYKDGKLDWSTETWKKVLFEMKKFKVLFEMKYTKYELVLGGEWKRFKDLPHAEIRKKEI